MSALEAQNLSTFQPSAELTGEHLSELNEVLSYGVGGPRPKGSESVTGLWLPRTAWTFQANLALRWLIDAVDTLHEMQRLAKARTAAQAMLDVVDSDVAEVILAGLAQPHYQVGPEAIAAQRLLVGQKVTCLQRDYQILAHQHACAAHVESAA